MKKLVAITLCCLAIISANAQDWYAGPQLSLNLCSLTKIPNSKTYPGFAIGAFGGYEIDDVFGIEAHLTVSNQGVKSHVEGMTGSSVSATIKHTYINFPVMAKFNIYKGIFGLAGVQTGVRVSSKLKYEDVKVNVGGDYRAMDFGLIFGLGYQFDFGLRAGISYNLGLVNVAPNDGCQNRVFAITAGWRF